MKGKTREQVESGIKGLATFKNLLGLITVLLVFTSIFTFVFGNYDAAINSGVACVAVIVLVNILARMILSLRKDLLFYPEDKKDEKPTSKFDDHLKRSMQASIDEIQRANQRKNLN